MAEIGFIRRQANDLKHALFLRIVRRAVKEKRNNFLNIPAPPDTRRDDIIPLGSPLTLINLI